MASIEPSVEVSETISRKPEPASSTCTPWRRTESGRRGSTRLMRFCTSTDACDGSVPGAKVMLISADPEALEVDSK